MGKAIDAIGQKKIKKGNLIWLELTGCAGNIISLLDGAEPNFKQLATQLVNFIYDNSLMAAEGALALEKLFGVPDSDFILAVEGAVSTENSGLYNIIGRRNGCPSQPWRPFRRWAKGGLCHRGGHLRVQRRHLGGKAEPGGLCSRSEPAEQKGYPAAGVPLPSRLVSGDARVRPAVWRTGDGFGQQAFDVLQHPDP